MVREFPHMRRQVEHLPGSGPCNGYHRVQRVVHVYGHEPTPPWPEEDKGERCACGAELEYLTVVYQH